MGIVVHGLGTVGLPLAAAIGARHEVVGVEVSANRRAAVLHRHAHLGEPGLREAVNHALDAGHLHVVAHPVAARTHVLCLPTPLRNHVADLGLLWNAVETLRPLLRSGDRVWVESTIPPGTLAEIAESSPGVLWAVAPERILPGQALAELHRVPRVVGGLTPEATAAAAEFYRSHLGVDVHSTDARTATVAKLAENAARDVQIALANELHTLAAACEADADAVLALARTHPRVDLLEPGIGVGGHCIPVDPWFLIQSAPDDARLLATARQVNEQATEQALATIRARADALGNPRIACLGIAYKPGVGDLRNSPALAIVQALHAEGRPLLVADPHVPPQPQLPWATVAQAVDGADLVVLLVAHPELRGVTGTRPVLDLCGAMR